MAKQIKIIIKTDEKDVFMAKDVEVLFDDIVIEGVHNVRFESDVEYVVPSLEITFANVKSEDLTFPIEEYIEILSQIPQIKIIRRKLFEDKDD